MNQFNAHIIVEKDGLLTPSVRNWSLEKYKLVGNYCHLFTTGMQNKWDQLIYIDLFAGAGHVSVIEKRKHYLNSALIAMSIPKPFSKYILCEQDEKKFEALELRVKRDFKHLNCQLILGDSNSIINQIREAIPRYSKGNTLLPFCFVDPYSLSLNFSTIRTLAQGLMDFLILQALHMDANRNFELYLREENDKIANYLGINNWREIFERTGKNQRKDFILFLANQYQNQMISMGYQENKLMHQIRSNDKNLPLYYLSFFSKHPRGEDFFRKVQKSVKTQLEMEF